MAKRLVKDSVAAARFRREIQAAVTLSNPNIVAAYDADCVSEMDRYWGVRTHRAHQAIQLRHKEELVNLTRRKLHSMARRPKLLRGLFFRCRVADLFR